MTLWTPLVLKILAGLAVLALVAAVTGMARYGLLSWNRAAGGDRPAEGALAEAPDRPLNVTLLGASASARKAWPERLAETLSACHGPGVAVRRVARVGMSSVWGEAHLGAALAPEGAPPPDVLVIHFTGNDAAFHRGRTLASSRAAHRRMIAAARDAGVPVLLATMGPAWGPRGWVRAGRPAYVGMYRDLADETGAGLIDTLPAWQALPRERLRALVPDGIHPTEPAMRALFLPGFHRALAQVLGLVPCPLPESP